MIMCPFEDLVVEVGDGLLCITLGNVYICRGVEEVIVEGPTDVLGGVNANWSQILVRVSNDDVFIATNRLEYPCLKLSHVQLPFSRSKLSPDCTFEVADTTSDVMGYLSWNPFASDAK